MNILLIRIFFNEYSANRDLFYEYFANGDLFLNEYFANGDLFYEYFANGDLFLN